MPTTINLHYQHLGSSLDETAITTAMHSDLPDTNDALWFQSTVESKSSDNISNKIYHHFSDISDQIKLNQENLNQRFQSHSDAVDLPTVMQTVRDMTHYNFQTQLVSKVISKSTKAFEKLTNLN